MNSYNLFPAKIVLGLAFLAAAGMVIAKVYPQYQAPCDQPVEYRLGSMDDGFNLSQDDFLDAIAEAEAIWEGPTNRELFRHTPVEGEVEINLIYDYRQEATDRLRSLGYKIENTQGSYNSLSERHESLLASYHSRKAALDVKIAQFESRKRAYENQVEKWNKEGGAPKAEATKLEAEYNSLNILAAEINREKDSINALVNEINALVGILNSLAVQLKLNVSSYNTIGQSRGTEFEEGVYVRDEDGVSINVFEFSDRDQLVRLLAHELGHALGLEHVEDDKAVMYRLNQNQNSELTQTDLAELQRVCRF